MSQKATLLDFALQIYRAGTSVMLAIAIGTAPDAAASIGFYGDTTGAAEKLCTVVGGQAGPICTRSGTDVNFAITGALSLTKQLTSTIATGSAPFVVASTTVVANLNVSQLLGSTWASPAAIGTGTPAAGTFSNITDAGLTISRVPYASTAGLLKDDASFLFDDTAKRLKAALNLPRTTFSDAIATIATGGCYYAQVGTMSASRAVTLPSASAVGTGAIVAVVDESGSVTATNTIVVTRAGSDTIDGASTLSLTYAYGRVVLASDGTSKWKVLVHPQVDVQVFTANGTWNKPAWSTTVLVTAIAAGGGGGSGRRGADGSVRTGGAGGGGGGRMTGSFDASTLGSTEAIVVGALGTGGPAQTVDDNNGTIGVAGVACVFGNWLRASGGAGGTAGNTTTTAGGAGGVAGGGGLGGAASTTGAAGGGPATVGASGAAGGGAGGGLTTGNVESVGAAGGPGQGPQTGGGTAGAVTGGNGGNGTAVATTGTAYMGAGGGGGGSSETTAGGTGGNGVAYGGGGGGGGASKNGFSSGAGGNGGPGILIVISR